MGILTDVERYDSFSNDVCERRTSNILSSLYYDSVIANFQSIQVLEVGIYDIVLHLFIRKKTYFSAKGLNRTFP